MSDKMKHSIRGVGDPALVFVHGFLCRPDDWASQIAAFSPSHLTINCQLRGHAGLPVGGGPLTVDALADDLCGLLEDREPNGPILIGHSMGCRIVMEACLRSSVRPGGMILIDGSRLGEDTESAREMYRNAINRAGYNAFVEALFDGMFMGEHPTWRQALIDGAMQIPSEIGMGLFMDIVKWDCERLEPALREIEIPTLVIQSTAMGSGGRRRLAQGEQSQFQELAMRLARHCTSVTVHGAGHFCIRDSAATVNDAIRDHIERIHTARQ